VSKLNPAALLLSLSCFAVAACSSNTLDRGDFEKCLAGEVFTNGKCLPTGCSQDIHCDDGEYCNGVEICDSKAGCARGTAPACNDAVDCTVDTCNEDLDACQHVPDDKLCASTEVCDPVRNCVPRHECQTDADCPSGMICQNDVCIGQTEEPGPSLDGGDDGGISEDDGGISEDDGGPVDDGDDGYDDDGQGDGDGVEECTNGVSRSCDTGMPGECAAGKDYCQDGVWLGCQQTYFAKPETCDGLDNDCNGEPDDEGVCACLTGCQDIAVCDPQGDAQCEQIPGYLTACIERCVGDNACPSSTGGKPKVCVDVPKFALGRACVCETEACPQECRVDQDCYPYGLTFCDSDSKCRGLCEDNFNCPPPYVCEPTQGVCVCDPTNIGFSCLACDLETDCHLGAFCTYRDTQRNPGILFKECQYDCTKNAECPQAQYGDKLYCHWGEGNTPNRCVCSPEFYCQECIPQDPDPCEISWMNCMSFTNPWGDEINTCTAACQSSEFCPAGWYCWDDGVSTHGWCIEKECYCIETQCGPDGISPSECLIMFPEFKCISDIDQDPPVELCTKYCRMHSECPLGYWCDSSGGATNPICRCNAR
jgi:hypothetical protein